MLYFIIKFLTFNFIDCPQSDQFNPIVRFSSGKFSALAFFSMTLSYGLVLMVIQPHFEEAVAF